MSSPAGCRKTLLSKRAVRDEAHRKAVLELPCWFCNGLNWPDFTRGNSSGLPTTGHHVHRGSETRNDYRQIPLCGDKIVSQGCHAYFEKHGRWARDSEERAIVAVLKHLYPEDFETYLKKAGRQGGTPDYEALKAAVEREKSK